MNSPTPRSGWKLKRTAQCRKCPWRIETNPREIPNGYSEDKHRALENTIAKPSDGILGPSNIMACHETQDAHCIGWLVNQIGSGNNIGMRIRMMNCENADKIRLRGAQTSMTRYPVIDIQTNKGDLCLVQ